MINLIVAPTIESGRTFQRERYDFQDWHVVSPESIKRGAIRGTTIGHYVTLEGAYLDQAATDEIRVRQSRKR